MASNKTDKPEATGGPEYIWLRYATQFASGGRTHTIEMGIPVPLGADAETRARLILEAEAGMDQLSNHVEGRVNQILQAAGRPQGHPARGAGNAPALGPQSTGRTGETRKGTGAGSAPPSTNVVSIGTTNHTPPEKIPAQDREIVVPPTRAYVGSSMPTSPLLQGEINGNLKLTQFLHIIRETMGLSSQQARELLQVPTLNDLNLREALERLQQIMAQKAGASTEASPDARQKQQKGSQERGRAPGAPPPSTVGAPGALPGGQVIPPGAAPALESSQADRAGIGPTSTYQAPAGPARPATGQGQKPEQRQGATPATKGSDIAPAMSLPSAKPASSGPDKSGSHSTGPAGIPVIRAGTSPTPTFEDRGATGWRDPGARPAARPPIDISTRDAVHEARPVYRFEEEDDLEFDELDDLYEGPKLTAEERLRARDRISEMKALGGPGSVSGGRLTVLHNVVGSQISDEQLQQLLQAFWGTTSEKKLKVDQVEGLISWAKEDEFVSEVDAVLALLEEE